MKKRWNEIESVVDVIHGLTKETSDALKDTHNTLETLLHDNVILSPTAISLEVTQAITDLRNSSSTLTRASGKFQELSITSDALTNIVCGTEGLLTFKSRLNRLDEELAAKIAELDRGWSVVETKLWISLNGRVEYEMSIRKFENQVRYWEALESGYNAFR